MPRRMRQTPGGCVFHVINRGVGRRQIFYKPEDCAAFERVMAEAHERVPIRVLAFCLKPNHWHFVLWPRTDEEVPAFTKWLTHTHTQRWHAHYHSSGTGHLYQGRYKSFPVQANLHVLLVMRYVERNALRAGLVERAEEWRWGSLWRRQRGHGAGMLAEPPLALPAHWAAYVNEPDGAGELAALRHSVNRGTPFGEDGWRDETAAKLGLESTLRPRGRPKAGAVEAEEIQEVAE